MKKVLLSILTITTFSFLSNAQNVNIPDANFKAYLLGNTAINTNADTAIQVSEAQVYSNFINCENMSITDLTGIEAFTALTNLNCKNNQITALDLSQNTSLNILLCGNNPVTNLSLPNSINLTHLDASSLQISSLDVSGYTGLVSIQAGYNPIINELNVANGNNINFTHFNSFSTPNLNCIQVDDVAYSNSNWTGLSIDNGDNFSLNCGGNVGVDESTTVNNITIYPNPTTGILNIKNGFGSVRIVDLTGKVVLETTVSNDQIDVSNLLNGVYLLQLKTEKGIATQRFIKE